MMVDSSICCWSTRDSSANDPSVNDSSYRTRTLPAFLSAIAPCHIAGLAGLIELRKSATLVAGSNRTPVTAATSARICLATAWKNLATRLVALASVVAQRETLSANHSGKLAQYDSKLGLPSPSVMFRAGEANVAGEAFARFNAAVSRLRSEFMNCSTFILRAASRHAVYSFTIASFVANRACTKDVYSMPCPSSCARVSIALVSDSVGSRYMARVSWRGPNGMNIPFLLALLPAVDNVPYAPCR